MNFCYASPSSVRDSDLPEVKRKKREGSDGATVGGSRGAVPLFCNFSFYFLSQEIRFARARTRLSVGREEWRAENAIN